MTQRLLQSYAWCLPWLIVGCARLSGLSSLDYDRDPGAASSGGLGAAGGAPSGGSTGVSDRAGGRGGTPADAATGGAVGGVRLEDGGEAGRAGSAGDGGGFVGSPGEPPRSVQDAGAGGGAGEGAGTGGSAVAAGGFAGTVGSGGTTDITGGGGSGGGSGGEVTGGVGGSTGGASGSTGGAGGGTGGAGGDPPCASTFFNLQLSALDGCLSYWKASGYRLQTLAVSFDGTWFSGSLRPGVAASEATTLLTGEQFDTLMTQRGNAGFVPRDINVSQLSSSDVRFSAIWQPAEGSQFAAFRELPSSVFSTNWTAYYDNQYTLTDWVIRLPSAPVLSGTWQKLAEPWQGFGAYYNMTSTELDSFATNAFASLQVTQLRCYDVPGEVRYAAIWRPVPWLTRWVRLSTLDEQAAIQGTMEADGYYLYQLHAIDANRFASVWRRDP